MKHSTKFTIKRFAHFGIVVAAFGLMLAFRVSVPLALVLAFLLGQACLRLVLWPSVWTPSETPSAESLVWIKRLSWGVFGALTALALYFLITGL